MADVKKKAKKKDKAKAHEDPESTPLSERLELQRTHMICGPEMNYHVHTQTSALTYMACGFDNSWRHEKWADNLQIEINHVDNDTMEFELIGIDPALANAFRRVLISEVPTVCIEHVFIVYNTSIMQEEVLSHRLGLVPLAIDPDALQFKNETADETNTVVFKMHVACTKNADGTYNNSKVLSSDLKWAPEGSEFSETSTRFVSPQADSLAAKPVHEDILLCKLRPGQEIQLEAHAVKGVGKDHSKWSPVATAWYRLHPEVVALTDIPDQIAVDLAQEVPGIFSVTTSKSGAVELKIDPARKHEDVLERVRHMSGLEKYSKYIEVRKRKEHFIFTIESVGSIPPAQLFLKALAILRGKCEALSEVL